MNTKLTEQQVRRIWGACIYGLALCMLDVDPKIAYERACNENMIVNEPAYNTRLMDAVRVAVLEPVR